MQIIMITHQAIIASKSDKHFYVRKTQDGTTSVDISVLEGERKLNAIAELAGGEVTEESLKFAQTLMGQIFCWAESPTYSFNGKVFYLCHPDEGDKYYIIQTNCKLLLQTFFKTVNF